MASIVECSISFSDGRVTRKTENVEGEGKAYMASLVTCLASMKEDVNTALTEQVAKDKMAIGSSHKRSSDEMISDDEFCEDVEVDSGVPPDSKQQKI